ncbi:P-loop containing nucleoside triphosphate hydrolase protein [Melanomma pulvis-pyrius CBS 109.77]|uniref:ATP-dependent RNA helicase ROK1 n=1 Tax=Melanomma pulvis-pyrius CBS 109.77 TaxID=1314802 RepID=A0A6A6XJB5_9PLEO|nr:P-loop containing nucleoside triphosphate hydrolase protein [Melanomma pulvis-pyrius CBS 109.77]
MNVFKLLSRSSKPPQASPAHRLPSSGAVTNPQLFGHDVVDKPAPESNTSRKRKRGQDIAEPSVTLPAGLDFFGNASQKSEVRPKDDGDRKSKRDGEDISSDIILEESVAAERNDAETYDVDECKRVLRSHKLKIVVLEDFAVQEEETEREKRRKAKKRKRDKEKGRKVDKAKAAKRQLYPQPLTSFTQLRSRYEISRRLAENLKAQGYEMTTEVQLAALPLLLGNKKGHLRVQHGSAETGGDSSGAEFGGDIDLLAVAPTGSGKTIAFLVPIIDALLSESKTESDSSKAGPRAIIIAPTKELASQIVNEARKLSVGTGIKAALMKKGMEVVEKPEDALSKQGVDSPEASDEEGDADASSSDDGGIQLPKPNRRRADIVKAGILVATPLAILNALKHHGDKVTELPGILHLVLDEADVLLDPLFREQTLAIWTACTNPHLRVGLWSATMGSNIETLAVGSLNDRWSSLSLSNLPRAPLIRLVVGLKDTAIPNITHQLTYAATEQGKLIGLRQLLHPTAIPSTDTSISLRPPFLVFTQTIPRAIALHSELLYDIPPEAGGSSRIAVLHADLSSGARETIMTRFRRGEIWVLITTDLLARGVDFRGLNGVVNYDVPNSGAAYVHRVGRTGRAGREGGVAVTFYTQEDIPYVKNVANVIRASEKLRSKGDSEGQGEGTGIQQWLLDALPTPSKRDKKNLKKRGVEARRNVKDKDGKGTSRISTKSGYDRRLEERRRGAVEASRRRKEEDKVMVKAKGNVSESEFEGFGE